MPCPSEFQASEPPDSDAPRGKPTVLFSRYISTPSLSLFADDSPLSSSPLSSAVSSTLGSIERQASREFVIERCVGGNCWRWQKESLIRGLTLVIRNLGFYWNCDRRSKHKISQSEISVRMKRKEKLYSLSL